MTSSHRPARCWPRLPEPRTLTLAEPPTRTDTPPSWASAILPALGMLPVAAFAFRGGPGTPLLVVLLLVPTLGGSVGMWIGQRRRARRSSRRALARWHAHRDALLVECQASADQQRRALDRLHPAARQLGALVAMGAAFERRLDDGDALTVAVGTATVPALVRIVRTSAPLADYDPAVERLAAEAVRDTASLDAAPVSVALRDAGVLALHGTPAQAVPVARAITAQLAVLHAPDDLALGGCVVDPTRWSWAAQLPHCRGTPRAARFGADGTALAAWLAEPSDQLRVALVEEYKPGACPVLDRALGESRNFAVVTGTGPMPARCGALFDLARSRLTAGKTQRVVDRPETLTSQAASTLGTAVVAAAIRPQSARPELRALLTDERPPLQVPIGVTSAELPVFVDFRQAADGGDGPHGLLVGATGSGKSVALQTVVAGLTTRHAPSELNLLLVDFKGGAAFDRFAGLPHVAGMVTNLEHDTNLLDRVRTSLDAELQRRQRCARAGRRLPTLVVVLDEAGELLHAAPEFVDPLVRIGRIGRSLGVHLLLATQRWDDGKLRALDAHLRLRLCLRTFTPDDSRAVLGDDAATRLPPRPGAAWLAVDGRRQRLDVLRAPTDLPIVAGPAAAPIWLPPLPDRLTEVTTPGEPRRPRTATIGRRDLPAEQRQPPLHVDLDGPGGHLAVVGGPRSGVSTALRTIVAELCASSGPEELAVHVLDFGGSLADLAKLPQVGTVSSGTATSALLLLGAVREELERRLPHPQAAPRWVLVIDGVRCVHSDDGAAESLLADLAARGLSAGIHLILGARRWGELRHGTYEACGTRLELRLGEPDESIAGRTAARAVPTIPGRGLLADGSLFQLTLCDVGQVAAAAQQRWPGARTPPIRPLPADIEEPAGGADGAFPLGVAGSRHEPVLLDLLAPGFHLAVSGDPRSGRTTVLRRVLRHLRDAPVELVVLDPRGGLLGPGCTRRPDDHAGLVTARSPGEIAAALDQVVAVLATRSAHAGSTEHGADVRPLVVVADDTDLVEAATALTGSRFGAFGSAGLPPGSGVAPAATLGDLAAYLPWSDELGLHLVVAGPAAGIRSALDPLGSRLRAAAAHELTFGASSDPAIRRPTEPLPAGRGQLRRIGDRPCMIQCFR